MTILEAAHVVRENAYAPYSGYAVGAAVRGADGVVYTGCNVENVAYPSGLCAERVAVGKMVSCGCREVQEVVVVTRDGGTPCGMCLQVLGEFAPDLTQVRVRTVDEDGHEQEYQLAELLPHAFRSAAVLRTDARPRSS